MKRHGAVAGTGLALSTAMLSRKRAIRYGVCAPALYRAAGQQHWSEGLTANVSPSGVLIVGDLPVACAEPIAVVIALPSSSGCLTGCGRITRVADVAPPHETSTFAISVPRFSIEHQSVALSRLDGLHQGC